MKAPREAVMNRHRLVLASWLNPAERTMACDWRLVSEWCHGAARAAHAFGDDEVHQLYVDGQVLAEAAYKRMRGES